MKFVRVTAVVAASAVLLLQQGCKPKAAHKVGSDRKAQMPEKPFRKIEPCELITKDEVGAVQKATILETKSSSAPGRGPLLMSQCYYAAKEPDRSVSVAVTQGNPQAGNRIDVREYWHDTFVELRGEKDSEREEKEEGKKRTPPEKIPGLGDDACWIGNPVGGALYVLKGEAFVRISVGGVRNAEDMRTRCRALAEKALERL